MLKDSMQITQLLTQGSIVYQKTIEVYNHIVVEEVEKGLPH